MEPGQSSTVEPDTRESEREAEPGERQVPGAGPAAPAPSGLSPALTRAVIEQLVRHGRELGRRDMLDLLGMRHGWKREVSEAPAPVAPSNLDA
jgi:hypothetical protein